MPRKFYPNQTEPPYIGKVRIVSSVGDILVAETTNNISAFDVVLPIQIPFKGAILNLMAAHFMKATEDIIPNCLIAVPHPRVSIWKKTTPFKFEVIVRAYNTGSFDRNYTSKGLENPWGYVLPTVLRKNEKLPFLMVTPTTKAVEGHDEDISHKEIINCGLATEDEWDYIEVKALELFERGQEMADKLGLILVDTKYEFGKTSDGTICLIDEVHTPDSSRYFYKDTYEKTFQKGEEPKALSKEFVRQWLIKHGFQGKEGDKIPKFSGKFIKSISERYVELYTAMGLSLTQLPLFKEEDGDVFEKVCEYLSKIKL
jgi:phosphoribosylaminoimidazole-succinocarboxamide synthase